MSRPVLPAIVLACLFSFCSTGVFAHQSSDSYLNLKIEDVKISGQWDIAVRDLDYALGLDGNKDGDVTWGELKSKQSEIATYVLERFQVKVNGRLAPVQITEHAVDHHTDGPYAVLRFSVENSVAPRFLEADCRTFLELDPQHRGFVRVEAGGEVQTAIFSPEQTAQLFELGHAHRWTEWIAFVGEGVWHIWVGFDHILFLIALLLPAVLVREPEGWRVVESFRGALMNVIKIVTAFTIAHSITLGLATFEIVKLPSRFVESAIAASVVFAALHNFYPVLRGKCWIAAFGFGLIHGFGFANVLLDLGLGQGSLALALVGFNVGVELGQLAIVSVFLPIAYLLRRSWYYRGVALRFGSAAIIMIASLWMVERVLNVRLLRF